MSVESRMYPYLNLNQCDCSTNEHLSVPTGNPYAVTEYSKAMSEYTTAVQTGQIPCRMLERR